MSLRLRLLLGFATLLVLAAVIGAAGTVAIGRLGDLALAVYDEPLQVINYTRSASQKFERLYLVGSENLTESLEDIEADLKVIAERAHSPEADALLTTARQAVADWQAAGEAAKAAAAKAAEAAFVDLIDYAEAAGYKFRAKAEETVNFFNRLALMGAAITLGVGLLLSLLMARAISTPIRRAVAVLERLGSGQLQHSMDFGRTEGRDEMASLARSMKLFHQNMLHLESLKAAEEEQRIARREERHALVDRLAAELNTQMGTTIGEVAGAVKSMSARADIMVRDADAASEQSALVAAAAEETSTSMRTVAQAIDLLSQAASNINGQVKNAASVSTQAAQQAEQADSRVRGLAEASLRVGEASRLIGAIAAQTNLLALNAAVEAARAGEAGRGFAVVAAEVKQLANQTAASTQEIGGLIEGIRQAAEDAVGAIDRIVSTITGVQQAAGAIAQSVLEQDQVIVDIGRNIDEVAHASDGVARSIVAVNEAARGTRQSSADVREAAQGLSQQAANLSQATEHFIAELLSAKN
jgi:methyl-accepting chemotaxis protein